MIIHIPRIFSGEKLKFAILPKKVETDRGYAVIWMKFYVQALLEHRFLCDKSNAYITKRICRNYYRKP